MSSLSIPETDQPYGFEIYESAMARAEYEAAMDADWWSGDPDYDPAARREAEEAYRWPDCGTGECWHVQTDRDCPEVEEGESDE